MKLLPRDWAFSARIAPGLAADRLQLDGGTWRLSAMAMATRPISDSVVLGAGAITAYSFGQLLPLPAIYLDWSIAPGLRFETFLPAFAHLTASLGDRVEVGPRIDVFGQEYAIRDPRIVDGTPCDPEFADAQCMDNVAYSVVSSSLRLGVRIASTLWLSSDLGYTLYRRFEQRDSAGEPLDGGLQTLPNTWWFRTALTFRIPMPEEQVP